MKKHIKRTVYFKSKSDGRKKYKTERHRNGKITCFCPGNVYTGKCEHKKRAKHWK
jgi:hypothetical protein